MREQLLHFNGIDGSTGRYAFPPMSVRSFARAIQGQEIQPLVRGKGVVAGVDGSNPEEAGWGLVVPEDLSPSIREVLGELVRHRDNPHFKWLNYLAGESVSGFLGRHGAGPGPVVPERVPYFLLLIGSPEQIPFSFQQGLDVQYAVGRLDLEGPEEFERYVRSLLGSEKRGQCRRRLTFFGVQNPQDPATEMSSRCLVQPLFERCSDLYPHWQVVHHARAGATKARLRAELHGDARPALLFTAGHAVFFRPELVDLQRQRQGGLLMSDWPGPLQQAGPVGREHYFAADDLEPEANLQGLISFHFACFSGGTPRRDSFTRNGEAPIIASAPFVARLPQALLSHRRGAALAVVAHVDRAWETSFLWQGTDPQVAVFETALRLILQGRPVGYALEAFGQRYAELAVQVLTERLELVEEGEEAAAEILGARLWTAFHDARGYVLLGDPAVRLSLEDECPPHDSMAC